MQARVLTGLNGAAVWNEAFNVKASEECVSLPELISYI